MATPVSAMVNPFAAAASSICLHQGQARLQNPLFRPRFRQIRRPLRSARGELQTSEPSTATTASTSIRTHRVTVHDRERGVVHEFLVPEVTLISGFALARSPLPISHRISFFEIRTNTYCTRRRRRTYPSPLLAGTVINLWPFRIPNFFGSL